MIYIILILIQLLASTTHIFGKALTNDLEPSLVLFFRSLFASLIFLFLLSFQKGKVFRIERKDALPFVIIGILNIPLNQYLFFISVKLTSPSNVAFAYALTPVFILFLAKSYLHESITFGRWIGVLLAFSGISIILLQNGISFESENFIGNIIALTATFCWSMYSTYSKNLIVKYGSLYSTAIAMIFGFIFYLPITIITNSLNQIAKIQPVHWLEILYMAIVTSVIVYLLWFYTIKRLPVSKIGVFQNLQPVFTTILSVIIFNQQITAGYLFGGILVIIGVILTQQG